MHPGVAEGLQVEGAELGSEGGPEEVPETAQGGPVVLPLARGGAVGLLVVGAGPLPEAPAQLRDGEAGRVGDGELAAVREPLRDQPVVILAGRRIGVGTEVVASSIEFDERPTGVLVEAVGGDEGLRAGHGILPIHAG